MLFKKITLVITLIIASSSNNLFSADMTSVPSDVMGKIIMEHLDLRCAMSLSCSCTALYNSAMSTFVDQIKKDTMLKAYKHIMRHLYYCISRYDHLRECYPGLKSEIALMSTCKPFYQSLPIMALEEINEINLTVDSNTEQLSCNRTRFALSLLSQNRKVPGKFVSNLKNTNPKGFQILCTALFTNTTLTWLALNNNKINDESLNHIMTMLVSHPTLTKLDLNFNDISSKSTHTISEYIKQNTALRTLCLFNNSIGFDNHNLHFLAESLRHNSTLLYLDLCRNHISSDTKKVLMESKHENLSLYT